MDQGFDIWKLLAGLGIFMFGIFLMEESIKKLSGRAFKRFIRHSTTGRLKSITSGVLVTSTLQSSSAVSLMVLAFVGAGIMSMENAIGVLLGSNIGTTITSWIVATVGFKVNIESFALPLIGVGGLGLIFLGRSERYSNISKLLVGFGFLFMGLDYMKASVEMFADRLEIGSFAEYGMPVYIGLGVLFTAIMQSSSATMAVILTALNAHIIGFSPAAAMVIGANIGTTVTVFLGAAGATQIKKRVALSHFAFNFITGVVALLLMPMLINIVLFFFSADKDAVIALALFHTLFNVLGVLLFLPFIHPLARLFNSTFPDRKTELTLYINNATKKVPEAAIAMLRKETLHLIEKVLRHNLRLLHIDEQLLFTNENSTTSKNSSDKERYENLKLLQAEIMTFAAGVQEQELSMDESTELSRCLHSARMALHSAKTLKDIKHDFDEFESADNEFLNTQYRHFRRRLTETYLHIVDLLRPDNEDDKTEEIIVLLKQLRDSDREFVKQTTTAIAEQKIKDLEVSTVIIVNRAFLQSSKQVLLGIRELVLTHEELMQFERAENIADTLLENE